MRVFLGDLSYLLEANKGNLYTPLNIGYCASAAKAKFGADIGLGLFKDPTGLLRATKEYKPAIVGLSLYYWNAGLVKHTARLLKQQNPEVFITLGGPCIDIDKGEQQAIFDQFPWVDAIVPNEGEQGFTNLVGRLLGGGKEEVVPGATIRGGPQGKFIGTATDLDALPSPYLTGLMDVFLKGDFQPIIQSSRFCPFTCAFCVSGKDRGKLRAFPLEVVKAEIEYIAKKFEGPKDTLFYMTDENFGIMERDLTVADYIVESRAKLGYPNRIYFYNDKRFTQISRDLHERLGNTVWHGVCLSLQSENPDALKAISRRNLTDEQLVSALAWAKERKLKTSTELIFGLPGETLHSFLRLVDKCGWWGFDIINCYNLMLFSGIEMYRARYRQEHKLETRNRSRYITQWESGETINEVDEVVISADSFSRADFMTICKIGRLLEVIFRQEWMKPEVRAIIDQGYSLTAFLLDFLTPLEGDDLTARAHYAVVYNLEYMIFMYYEGKEDFQKMPEPPDKTLASDQNLPAIWQRVVERFMSKNVPTRDEVFSQPQAPSTLHLPRHARTNNLQVLSDSQGAAVSG